MLSVAITGAAGFIGQNICVRLEERGDCQAFRITRQTTDGDRQRALSHADVVVHLAGVNRPADPADFATGNGEMTAQLCTALRESGRAVPVIFASSIQAELDNPYGRSKLAAEAALLQYGADTGAAIAILRLANVFGKWSRPNYNSAVATFCHNIARKLPITVTNADAPLRLVHVDSVVATILDIIADGVKTHGPLTVGPVFETTVGALADTLHEFAASRQSLNMARVGTGYLRALYSTFVSYVPPDQFAYALRRHDDPRGVFAEILKTADTGQFSFFSAHPGVTRGGHYHHTKTEKFLVVKGTARFGFRHLISDERVEIIVHGSESRVVDTAPGWAHDITNIGDDEMYVLLWANEAFDPAAADTIATRVTP